MRQMSTRTRFATFSRQPDTGNDKQINGQLRGPGRRPARNRALGTAYSAGMKRIHVLLALLGLAFVLLHFRGPVQRLAWGTEGPGKAAAGAPAPEIPDGVRTLDGKALRLGDLRGKVVLLHFWTFGCSNCQRMLPHHVRWDRELRGKGLVVIGAHTPELPEEFDQKKVVAFVKEHGVGFPVLFDPGYKLWDRYGINAWPTAVVIDRQGVVRGAFVGDDQADAIDRAVKKLL